MVTLLYNENRWLPNSAAIVLGGDFKTRSSLMLNETLTLRSKNRYRTLFERN